MSASHLPPPPDSSAPVAAPVPPVETENPLPPEGGAPVSLRATVICGAVLILGGLIAGYGGNQFSYKSLFREGYVRERPPGTAITPPPPKKALDAYMARGARVYKSKCITCHGPEAKGGPTYPSLVGSPWALGETERFAMIILNGLQGGASDGKNYGVMTSQAPITPEELAGVMTYVRNHFGNTKGDVVSVEMARNAFTISAARKKAGQAVTGDELTADHLKNLPGKEIKPDDMVDPLTLLPVATPGAAKEEPKPDAAAAGQAPPADAPAAGQTPPAPAP
ncbi:MAG: cytochrome c [Akkermansiaceae bacterium]|nr:cytochrome c [Akkermansiaceae bacterium]